MNLQSGLYLVAQIVRAWDLRMRADWPNAQEYMLTSTTDSPARVPTPDAEPASTPGGGSGQRPHHDIAPAWPPSTAQGKP